MTFLLMFPGLGWKTGEEVWDMRFELWDAMRQTVDDRMDR